MMIDNHFLQKASITPGFVSACRTLVVRNWSGTAVTPALDGATGPPQLSEPPSVSSAPTAERSTSPGQQFEL